MAKFCERLVEAMRYREVTQSELCRRTGIGKSAMSQYISGKFAPKQTRTYLIANALNVSIPWLMGADVPMEADSEAFNPDSELNEYLEQLKNRSEMRMLFKLTKSATKEDVMKAVKIIEALKGESEDE